MLPDDFAAPQRGAQWHSGGGVQSLNTLWEWAGTSLGEGSLFGRISETWQGLERDGDLGETFTRTFQILWV